MTEFPLRQFPRRLARALVTFAGAGTLMAFLVYQDGIGGAWLPGFMVLACWAIPLLFAWQIRRNGFDPLTRFVATDDGLEAHYRDGETRRIPWASMRALVQIEGFRNKAWAIESAEPPLRWFGEVADTEAFTRLVSERSGLAWESRSRLERA